MQQQRLALQLIARSRVAVSEWLFSGVQGNCRSVPGPVSTSQAWNRSIATTQCSASGKKAAKAVASKPADDKEAAADSKKEVAQSLLFVDIPSTSLSNQHIGNYYPLQPQLIPEAFPEIHQAFHAPRGEGERPRRGGCLGLQGETAAVGFSGRYQQPVIMHREAMHLLSDRVLSAAGSKGGPVRALLQGLSGSGKSVALAALVERARAAGWMALYIPSARALIKGGYFTPRTGAPSLAAPAPASAPRTTYDTQISAQHILLSMRTAHAKQLSEMKVGTELSGAVLSRAAGGDKAKEGATVADVVEAGLATDTDGALAVDATLALISELAALPPTANVLFAVDDYNCLYGKTGYGRPHTPDSEDAEPYTAAARKLLEVEDLTLASQLRVLAPQMQGALGSNVHVVCAATKTNLESGTKDVQLSAGAVVLGVPRLSKVETAHAMQHYHECGAMAHPPTYNQVKQVATLTAGNWEELRRVAGTASILAMNRNKRSVLCVV